MMLLLVLIFFPIALTTLVTTNEIPRSVKLELAFAQ